MPSYLKGLTHEESQRQFQKFGPNKLPEKPLPSAFKVFVSQLKSPLVYILLVAAAVTFFLGEFTDTAVISFAVFVNTILGFLQERKANNALSALRQLIHPQAMVLRDGERLKVEVERIVPDDVCVINHGDKIPADGVLLSSNKLLVDEAILTGESVPVLKNNKDKVLMGTTVLSGNAYMRITETGKNTEVGKIALSVQETFEDTPLRIQLKQFSKQLTYVVVFLVVFVFVTGILSGRGLAEMFTTSVALAVSSIPEGLLVGLTVVLAIGMQRILKRKGLVRNLVSAETLGGVTTICTDKTGTLTDGTMKVVKASGNVSDIALQAIVANELDDPMTVAAYDWAKAKDHVQEKIAKYKDIDVVPFTSETKYFASLNKWDKENNMLFVNGAPEYLMGWSKLTESQKEELSRSIDEFTSQGMRVLGFARKKVPLVKKKISKTDVKDGLDWVGLLIFSDPVRKGVKSALEKAMNAGVKIVVITGDYAKTAISVLNNLGIDVCMDCVITGSEIEKIGQVALAKRLQIDHGVKLFARTTPHQKLKIVEALKSNGEVVAMTGDGVNDAPALNRADIGIVVGDATDVAKESADLILLNSRFETIVEAIEEGRGIFDNIRKIILYLMSDAFGEIVAVLGSIIISILMFKEYPLPVTAVQILWINLVSDGFPHLALTVDPKDKNIMKYKPRDPKEKIVSGWMKKLIMIVSFSGGIIALSLFAYFFKNTGDEVFARSIAFAALGTNSLFYVFSVRTLILPFWIENPFDNKWLNLAVLGGIMFQIFPFLFPWTRELLGITSLHPLHWLLVFVSSFTVFILIEIMKAVFRDQLAYSKTK